MGVISKTTLHDMLCEMQSFTNVSQTDLDAAVANPVDTDNAEFMGLVKEWNVGKYDEDPGLMLQALRGFLPRT
jgi:hypothetical protein